MSHRRASASLRAPDPAHLKRSRAMGQLDSQCFERGGLSMVLVGAAVAAPAGPATWICILTAAALGVGPSGRMLPVGLGVGLILGLPWPAPAAIALLAWGAGRPSGPLRGDRAPLVGPLKLCQGHAAVGAIVRYCAAVILGAAAGLVTVKMSADHLQAVPLLIEHQRPALAVVGVVVLVLATANSVTEELLWRVALWPRMRESRWIPGLIATQAVSFGLAHGLGIPGGALGMAAAGMYSAALTMVRLRGGLRKTLTIHLFTDVVIFGWVAQNAIFLPA